MDFFEKEAILSKIKTIDCRNGDLIILYMDFATDNYSLERAHDTYDYIRTYLEDEYPDSLLLGVDVNLLKQISVFPLNKAEKMEVLSAYRELHDLLYYLEKKYG